MDRIPWTVAWHATVQGVTKSFKLYKPIFFSFYFYFNLFFFNLCESVKTLNIGPMKYHIIKEWQC